MSGSQLKERVLIPLAVILATVGGLALLGTQLLGLSGASDEIAQPTPSVSASASPTDVMPSDSASPDPTGSVPAEVKRLPVIVLNGTDKVGYAKKVADNLNFEDWVIQEVGNWEGDKFAETMVFYPAGAEAAAQLLADSQYVKGTIAPAEAGLNQSVLTVILAK